MGQCETTYIYVGLHLCPTIYFFWCICPLFAPFAPNINFRINDFDMGDYKYRLQKYSGRNSRHTCPSCGRPHCFVLYVDANNNPVAEDVGRCEHRNSCGYEKTPKMWFAEHPEDRSRTEYTIKPHPVKEIKTDYIPFSLIQRSEGTNNNLMKYLRGFFSETEIARVTEDYHLGCTRKGETIFPQIDGKGMCRTGKVMQYGEDGHRVKGTFDAIDWLHSRYMKQQGKLSHDFNLRQCLFGEHLLHTRPNDIVCMTESEKSAVIASMTFPQFVWVSCGGKLALTPERCRQLAGRDVIVYADADATDEWKEKIKSLAYCRSIRISDWAKDEAQGSKRDIADLIIEEKRRMQVEPTTIGDVCRWMDELGIPKGRITFNI